MTRDELTDAVHKTLVNAYQMGYECGPGDVMIDIAAGEELATVIVNKVRAAEQRRIRAALRNDASVADRHGYGDKPMTNPEHDPRAEAVAKALSDADGMSWHNEGTYKTFTDAEWAGMEDETDDIPYERPSLGRDFYRDLARAAIAALDIPAIERAAYERGRAEGRRDCGVMPKDDGVWTFKFSIPLTGRSQPGDDDE